MKSYVDTGPFLAVQKAGAAALDQAEELVAPIRAELERRRDAAVAALREAGFALESPKAAMYLWVALPAGVPSAAFAAAGAGGDRGAGAAGQRVRPGGRRLLPDRADGGADRLREAAERLGRHARRPPDEESLRRPLDLGRLRRRSRWPWIAIAVSVAAHAALLLFGWIEGRLPEVPRRPSQLIVLAPPAEGPREVPMPYRAGRRADGQAGRGVVPTPAPPRPDPETPPAPTGRVRAGHRRAVPAAGGRQEPGAPARSAAPVHRRRSGRQRPTRAATPARRAGRAADRPDRSGPGGGPALGAAAAAAAEGAGAAAHQKSHAELVDSAVTAIVQGYLDSIAADPIVAERAGLPSWTTEVAGKKFGLDSKNIYIAGLKIPAAVLALLPIPAGNIDQNRAYNHLMELRADLHYAAQRAQNLEEFKDMIRDMRLRKEREREFERNQRTAPPPEDAGPPRDRMKLVDTEETVVLVTGSSLTAEERDRPLAYCSRRRSTAAARATPTGARWWWPTSGIWRTGSST